MRQDSMRRVLIVDDQKHIHDTFQRVFASKESDDHALADFESRFLNAERVEPQADGAPGFALTHAHSGEEAIEIVKQAIGENDKFSVAFVDMRMPCGIDGLETTERLWQIDPSLQVVICTAYSDHMWDDVLKQLGYSDRLLLLKKPFESDEARQLALALSEKSRLAMHQQTELDKLKHEVERRREAEESIRDMAHRDALTDLPNRSFLLDRLKYVVERRKSKQDTLDSAVLFLDLDNFKLINDSLGHDAGDDLLNQVAARLKECVREHDTATRCSDDNDDGKTVRLGGDEFVVMLEQLVDIKDALVVARRIVKRISEPFELSERIVTVGTSVGVAFINEKIGDANEALRNADTAMYRAKHAGKSQIAVFDQTMHEAVVARLEMEDQLRQSVSDQSFELRYQPIVDLQHAVIQGVEVLIRWKSESGDYVSPSEFIPIIEEIGLINQVGEWVLETSMRDLSQLMNRLPEGSSRDVYLGVNVSRRQLSDPFFLSRLDPIIDRTGFDRKLLKLEMNESSDPRHGDQSLATMTELHESGVGIQIDDFGKGHSSLTCFQSYPIETVKIDRSFTASIACDHSHAVITQAIVQLAHHLNAKIVAEGVESENQLEALRRWGCDSVQGYLFAPPLTIDELYALLRDPEQSEGIRMLRRNAAPIVTFDVATTNQPINLN